MIQRLFKNPSTTITSAALIVGISSLASRVLGLFRDRLFAYHFGAGVELDMYYAAFRIPDFVYNFVVFGSLSAAFIPILLRYIGKEEKEKANEFFSSVFTIFFILLSALSAMMIFFAPILTRLITPGFSQEQLQITIELTRILSLSPLLLGLSGVISSVLQATRHFVWYSMAPVMYNLGIIIGAIYFIDIWGVHGLAYGVLLGALMHGLVQIPGLFMTGISFKWTFALAEGIKEMFFSSIARMFTLVLSQIQVIIVTIFASTLMTGSIAMFQLAFNLQSVPVGLIGISFALAAFPNLALHAQKKEWRLLSAVLSSTIRQILFFIIPVTVMFIVLRAQIVRLILGTGAFDWQATIFTADALGIFAISLFAQCLIPLLVRAFYALDDFKTPLYIGIVSTFLYVLIAFFFSQQFGFLGLVFSFTVLQLVYMMFLLITLYAKVHDMQEKKLFLSSFKIFIASMVMGMGMQTVKYLIAPFVDMQTFLGIFIQTISAITIGGILFIVVSTWLKSEEMKTFLQAIMCRLKCVKDFPRSLFPSE